jgi:hypothetical protein
MQARGANAAIWMAGFLALLFVLVAVVPQLAV